jgi:hypothetical protein
MKDLPSFPVEQSPPQTNKGELERLFPSDFMFSYKYSGFWSGMKRT